MKGKENAWHHKNHYAVFCDGGFDHDVGSARRRRAASAGAGAGDQSSSFGHGLSSEETREAVCDISTVVENSGENEIDPSS